MYRPFKVFLWLCLANPALQLLVEGPVGISSSLRLSTHTGGALFWVVLCTPCLSLEAHEQRSELLERLPQMKCVRDKDYVPNFKTAFEHFLVHTGGRAVIEEVEKKLRLDPADVQPSKETLYRYGNTCCAAVFYVLTNMESRVSTCTARPPTHAAPFHPMAPAYNAANLCCIRERAGRSLSVCSTFRDSCQGCWKDPVLPE